MLYEALSSDYTLKDTVFERLMDFQADFTDLEHALTDLSDVMAKVHRPIETRFQKLKAIQFSCVETLQASLSVRSGIADALEEYEELEKTAHPLPDAADYFYDDKQPFFRFYENLRSLDSVITHVSEQLESYIYELELLEDVTSDCNSDITEMNQKLDDLSSTLDSILEDLDV